MAYHLDLTLQQRATISAATSIWNNQKVKDKISKWSDNYYHKIGSLEVGQGWQQLTKQVLEEVHHYIPPRLQAGLNHAIIKIGEKIMNWYIYIWNEHYDMYGKKMDVIDYIEEIYWTSIGTIDEVKTLQSLWSKNPDLDVAVLYNIACKNTSEEDIDDLWQEMPCDMEDRYDNLNLHAYYNSKYEDPHYDYDIIAYWKYCRDGLINHNENNAVSDDLSEDELGRIAYYSQNWSLHTMFLISVYRGYSTAVKYFWKKLTQEEKDKYLLFSAYIAVDRGSFSYKRDKIADYKKEKYVEILIFLINQMTMDEKELFFDGELVPKEGHTFDIGKGDVKRDIFSMLLSTWPWQELFIPVLNNMFQYLEHNTEPVLEALSTISKKMATSSYVEESNKYRSILHKAWSIIPGSIKRTMINQNDPNNFVAKDFICIFLQVWDLDSIKMVFDDPEIADVRMEYINLGRWRYQDLIEANEYELLDQFMEEVLQSEEEKIFLKSVINDIDECNYLIAKRQYDLADNFLNWKFETVKERKQCKDYFKEHKFSIDWIWNTLKLSGGSVEKAKEETSRFLKWMFESDDIALFKRDFIANSEPLIEQEVHDSFGMRTLFKEEARKIRQILE